MTKDSVIILLMDVLDLMVLSNVVDGDLAETSAWLRWYGISDHVENAAMLIDLWNTAI
ncbi:hypothetical protein SEA_NEDARYA_89 [Gordonia phage Nedarya]|nr:hypothetical protein SEA_NEDARYA_89 [Gordonia phage Nedarya]